MEAANYINQLITKLKKHINNNTIMVGDFNTLLATMDKSSNHNINKEARALKRHTGPDGLHRYIQNILS